MSGILNKSRHSPSMERVILDSIDPDNKFDYHSPIPGPAADGWRGDEDVGEQNHMNNTLKVTLAMTFMVAGILAAVLTTKHADLIGQKPKPSMVTKQQYDAIVATAALGGVLLLVAISRYLWKKSKMARCLTASGKFVDFREYGSGRSRSLRPIVVFHDSGGKKVEFRGRFKSRTDKVGGDVPVRYDPAGSSCAFIDRDFELYSREYLLLMLSSGMLLLGLMFILCTNHP